MRLHVLTAVTRPENLPALSESLSGAAAAGVDIIRHLRADPERQAVGGQALKNAMLQDIEDGWVYILDDDNIAHPGMFAALIRATLAHPSARLIAIAQQHRNGWIRRVHRLMLRQTHVDAGQVVIRRDAIGDKRIPEHYCGDGQFIEEIASSLPDDQIAYIYQALTYYNWLRAG